MGALIYDTYEDYVNDNPQSFSPAIRPPHVQKILERACLTAKECEALAVVEHKGELTRAGREHAAVAAGTAGALIGLAGGVLAAALIHPMLLALLPVLVAVGGTVGFVTVAESEDDA